MKAKEQVTAAIAERNRRQKSAIDTAMNRAAIVYDNAMGADDPYAMHKAVESIPLAVLVNVIHRKTQSELEG